MNDGISEVYVMPTYGKGGSDAHIVSMRKAGGEWWHFVGNVLQRKATTLESLLPLAPALWQELAECEGWWKRAEDAEANLAEVEMLSAKVAKVADRIPRATLFTCRCCDRSVQGRVDGTVLEPGWRRIERIDGPNAICPSCEADPTALDALRLDGYEDAHLGASMPVQP